jgi:hypothetical protein
VWLACLLGAFLSVVAAMPAHAQTLSIRGGNNQTGVVGTTLPTALSVRVRTAAGVAVPGVQITFAIASGGGSLSALTVVTNSRGNASTSYTLNTVAGPKVVTATASGIGSVTFNETAVAAAAAKLAIAPLNAATPLNTAVAYAATVQDQFGNTVTTAINSITFAATGVTGTFSPAATVAAVAGIARASFTPGSVGAGTIAVSATGLAGASTGITVQSGAPTRLSLTPGSASTTAGAPVSYTVTVLDAAGNRVTTATNAITLSANGFAGTFAPGTTLTAAAGQAAFTFTPTATGTATISASATGLTGASVSLGVSAAVPAKLALAPLNATTSVGAAVAYTATIQDRFGNTVTTATSSVTFAATTVTGSFSPAATVAAVAGVARASFTPSAAGTGTIAVSATGLTGASTGITAQAGTATRLTLTPASASASAGGTVNYTVTVVDAAGNRVTSATNVITLTANGFAGTLSPGTSVTAAAGQATFTFTPTATGTSTLGASATGLTAASATLTVSAGAAAKLALRGSATTAVTGVGVTYTATVQDAFGNSVTNATNGLTFGVTGVSGTFNPSSVESPVVPVNGVATTTFTAATAGTGTITVAGVGLTGASAVLTVTQALPAKLSITPATATTRTGVTMSYTIAVLDANGNLVPNATNAIALAATGVAGTFSPATTVTAVNGLATASFTPSLSGSVQATATITATSGTLTAGTASLTVTPVTTATSQTLFTTQTPVLPNASDGVPYELGMKFRAARPGVITAIRYWRAASDAIPHTGRIWAANGTQLTSVGFSGESASGWQQQALPVPLHIDANVTYVVSVNVNSNYPFTSSGLATSIVNGDLSSVADGANGVFGSPFAFPVNSFQSANYFRDVVFVPDSVPSLVKVSGDKQSAAGGTVLPSPLVVAVRDGSNNPIANATVTFAVTGGTGSVSATSVQTNASGQASTTLTLGAAGITTVQASVAGIGSVVFSGYVPNAIHLENEKPGTTAWQITNPVSTTNWEIAGYAGATSINRGESLPLMISLSAPGQYRVEVYRLGFYAGQGGRLVFTSGTLSGVTQAPCNVTDAATQLIECKWTTSTTLVSNADWTTGLYVAKLTALASGKQSQIWFVVRDDASHAELLFQSSFNTFLAYNSYGTTERHSLYEYNSTNGRRAFKVSFDRPFGQTTFEPGSSNKMIRYERNMARWLESQGYDVTYISNLDTHLNPGQLLNHKAFLSVGHDEYWSLEMRNGVEAARDAGINLGFFSANTAYWRVRFEPSTSGVANRVMVCYKDPAAKDPVAPTYLWRGPENNRPENALLGVMYVGDNDTNPAYNWVVVNSNDPYYANTGVKEGTVLPAIVGYEWDAIVNNGATPAGLVMLSSSPTVPTTIAPGLPAGTSSSISNAARYTAASGAKVFATGSIEFSWGVDSDGVFPAASDVRVKQFTVNVLSSLGARPVTPDDGIVLP